MKKQNNDHTLEILFDLVGTYFHSERVWTKIEAKRIKPHPGQPFGVKYSLTLHIGSGERVLGYDNAHAVREHRKIEWDHIHKRERIKPYKYRSAIRLLEDFFTDVDR